jgi:hypothetical protein
VTAAVGRIDGHGDEIILDEIERVGIWNCRGTE